MISLLRRAPLTAALLVSIVSVFLLQVASGLAFGGPWLVRLGASYAPAILGGQLWRLVTAMFLHADVLHLLFNGWALFQLGALVELWMGSRRFALVYFVSGLAGSLASVGWDLVSGQAVPSVGASGAVFGLLGALIAFLGRRRGRLTPQARSLLFQLLFWAGINIFFGFTAQFIDNAAHLGGFFVGLGLGAFVEVPRIDRPPPVQRLPPDHGLG